MDDQNHGTEIRKRNNNSVGSAQMMKGLSSKDNGSENHVFDQSLSSNNNKRMNWHPSSTGTGAGVRDTNASTNGIANSLEARVYQSERTTEGKGSEKLYGSNPLIGKGEKKRVRMTTSPVARAGNGEDKDDSNNNNNNNNGGDDIVREKSKDNNEINNNFNDPQSNEIGNPNGLGTFLGVYKPVIFTQWGVLIFVRFSVLIGYTGWAMALGFVILSLSVQVLTTLSLCAVMSNSPPMNSRIMGVFSANVGQSLAAVICTLYYLALTFMSQVELLGSIQAVNYVMVNTESSPNNFTGSAYWDQVVLGIPALTLLFLARTFFSTGFHIFGLVTLLAVLVSLILGIAGLFATSAGWQVDEARGVLGINGELFHNNTFSNWTKIGHDESAAITSPDIALGIIYPCFIGVFQGANTAATLKNPSKSIIKGTLAALATSTSLYTTLFLLFASIAVRDTLKEDILLFSSLTWPSEYVGYVGAILVGLGSCAELIELGPTVLQAIAQSQVSSALLKVKLDKLHNGKPMNAILASYIIQLGLVFLGSQYFDLLATIVAVWILFAYTMMHLSLFLNETLRMAGWRPTFKYFHWSLAFLGFIATLSIAIFINYILSFITIVLIAVMLFILKIVEEPKASGLGTRGLQISSALRFLLSEEYLSVQEDLSEKNKQLKKEHTFWTPQILCFTDIDETGQVSDPKLLHWLHQLQGHSRVTNLTIVAHIMTTKDSDIISPKRLRLRRRDSYRNALLEQDTVRKKLQKQLYQCKVEGFPEVVSAQSVEIGRSILTQSLGLGALRPNLTVVCFPQELEENGAMLSDLSNDRKEEYFDEQGRLLIQLFNETLVRKKSCIVIKGIRNFPLNNERMEKGSTIDVWWIIHTGGLQLLLAHLLRQQKVWRKCKIRLFVPVLPDSSDPKTGDEGLNEPSLQRLLDTQIDVERIVNQMRFDAEVMVIPVSEKVGEDHIFDAGKTIREKQKSLRFSSIALHEAFIPPVSPRFVEEGPKPLETIDETQKIADPELLHTMPSHFEKQPSTRRGLLDHSLFEKQPSTRLSIGAKGLFEKQPSTRLGAGGKGLLEKQPSLKAPMGENHQTFERQTSTRLSVLNKSLFEKQPSSEALGSDDKKDINGVEKKEDVVINSDNNNSNDILIKEGEEEDNDSDDRDTRNDDKKTNDDDTVKSDTNSLPVIPNISAESEPVFEIPNDVDDKQSTSSGQQQIRPARANSESMLSAEKLMPLRKRFASMTKPLLSGQKKSKSKPNESPHSYASNQKDEFKGNFASVAARNVKAKTSLFADILKRHSENASLVIINLPVPKRVHHRNPSFYAKTVSELTSSLNRVLLVGASGEELITVEARDQAFDEEDLANFPLSSPKEQPDTFQAVTGMPTGLNENDQQ